MYPIVYASAAAIFDRDNRLLISKRPENKIMGGYWEFPGGKLLTNELPRDGLYRELKEELGITICKNCFTSVSFLSVDQQNFHLILYFFAGRKWEGIVFPRENQELKWVKYDQLKQYDLLPDNEVLIYSLAKYL